MTQRALQSNAKADLMVVSSKDIRGSRGCCRSVYICIFWIRDFMQRCPTPE